jgi:HlyD family secretion protein
MKIKIKYIVIIVILILIAWIFVLPNFFKSPIDGFITEKVSKGNVLQEISESGNVKATDAFNLGFKSVGKVAHIYVAVGDVVKKGEVLASLDSTQISAQLQAAKASLNYTTNQYDSGVVAAKDNLQSAYNSATNTLNDSYTKIYNAYNAVIDLVNTYYNTADQEGIKVTEAKSNIQQNMQNAKLSLDNATTNLAIDTAVSNILVNLDKVYNDLKIIRDQCDIGIYYSKVSSTYKTSIDTQKTNINTAIANVTASQASINAYKIALQKAQDSQIEQAQANVDLYQSQLQDFYLRAPMDGTITQVNIKKGETVSMGQPAITLLSTNPFQIKVYIYEQDIVNVKVGQDVKIDLVAFPKQTFNGKVLLIDPAETIIDNIIYYQVTIDFPNQPENIKSGMTADITIQTAKKENVLRVTKNAIQNIEGQDIVQIVVEKQIKDQKIVTGLEGNDYYEILSGLLEGDIVVIGKK